MKLGKTIFFKSDGRKFIQYHCPANDKNSSPLTMIDEGLVRPSDWQPPKLRYIEMRDEWVAISPSRNHRPFLPPKQYCPLCPTNQYLKDEQGRECKTDVPQISQPYEWAAFENMFPGLSSHHKTGHCEVILYSPDHHQTLASCSIKHIEGLILVWQDRSQEIGKIDYIKQVFIFENKGTEVGVTLHHPHGQLYGFNHVPPFLAREQTRARKFFKKTGQCSLCFQVKQEIQEKKRLISETENIIAFVPEGARYPYEVHITSKHHRSLIEHLVKEEVSELALVIKRLLGAYNHILNIEFPYIMVHHQAPHNSGLDDCYHWHIEFYPPYRAKDKLKFLAGVESGTGLFINDTIPEEKAAELRVLCAQQNLHE